MGVGFIYAIATLILLLIVFTGLLLFFIKRRSKVGITISSIFIVFFLAILFTNYIDQWTITKNDVKNDLTYFDVKLNDDFEITSNSVSGMPERFQETELTISKEDAKKILYKIKSAPNFKVYKDYNDTLVLNAEIGDESYNFKYPTFYSAHFIKNQRIISLQDFNL